jgi:organic radical activating enzyme
MHEYGVSEVFYSLQGEGVRAGEPSVFVRFAGCNLDCQLAAGPRSPGGFVCDTDFSLRFKMPALELAQHARQLGGACAWAVLTGGEPALQAGEAIKLALRREGFKLAIETNGTIDVGADWDWITVSPKVPEQALRQHYAHEVKYVVAAGAPLPVTTVDAAHYLLSPATRGAELDEEALAWCIRLVQENPKWRLSVQQHKIWKVR